MIDDWHFYATIFLSDENNPVDSKFRNMGMEGIRNILYDPTYIILYYTSHKFPYLNLIVIYEFWSR